MSFSLKQTLFSLIEKFVRFRQQNPKLSFFLIIVLFTWLYHRNKKYIKGRKSLKDKRVLITGGVSGIGRLTALLLKDKGAKVIVWDINDDGLREMNENVDMTLKCDITNKQNVDECAQKVLNKFGAIDILINNAGIVIGKSILDLKESQIRKCFEVNVISHFWTIKAFLPGMISQKYGHIVTISSTAGRTGVPFLTDYCASKYGCRGLTESVKQEMGELGHDFIQTTNIMPYLINTGMFTGAIDARARIMKIFGLYFLEPDYVAQQIVRAIQYNIRNLVLPPELAVVSSWEHTMPDGLKDYLLAKGPSFGRIVGRAYANKK